MLGVEGMSREVIEAALKNAGATVNESSGENRAEAITKLDLFEAGLSGGKDSYNERQALLKKLNLPAKLSPNAMLDVLNVLMTREEFLKMSESHFG